MELNLFNHFSTMFDDIKKKIEELAQSKIVHEEPSRSPEIKELAIALAKAQAEMPVADLNKENPYFKSTYADLQSIVSVSRPSLTKYGLSVTQQINDDTNGMCWLITTLWHVSGQWISSKRRIVPTKNDIQAINSHTTYLKRMCYSSLIGVVSGDYDDDGEAAVATTRETFAKGVALNRKYDAKNTSPDVITKEQLEELEYELSEHTDIAEMVLEGLKLQSLADMPKSKFQSATRRIREIKDLRNNGTTHKG